jgi:hypothetical protein
MGLERNTAGGRRASTLDIIIALSRADTIDACEPVDVGFGGLSLVQSKKRGVKFGQPLDTCSPKRADRASAGRCRAPVPGTTSSPGTNAPVLAIVLGAKAATVWQRQVPVARATRRMGHNVAHTTSRGHRTTKTLSVGARFTALQDSVRAWRTPMRGANHRVS